MRLLRCCLTGLTATALTALALDVLRPSLAPAGSGFEEQLVRGCAVAAAACVLWGWTAALAVVAEALRTPDAGPAGPRGVPRALRRLVLAGCGVALGAAAPALAASGTAGVPVLAAVAGLPLPERAMDGPALTTETVVVRPGDSLWAITARHLPADAGDAAVTTGWHDLYAVNRDVVGDDPSLIHPGQHLVLPDHLEEPR